MQGSTVDYGCYIIKIGLFVGGHPAKAPILLAQDTCGTGGAAWHHMCPVRTTHRHHGGASLSQQWLLVLNICQTFLGCEVYFRIM